MDGYCKPKVGDLLPTHLALAAALYNRLEDISGYVRTKGFDKIQQHQMVLSALDARKDKRITREDVVAGGLITR